MAYLVGSAVLYALIATTAGLTTGSADDLVSSKATVGEASLDLNKDGKIDRAVLVQSGANASVDLYIYFGSDGDTQSASSRPPIIKHEIASGAFVAIESGHNGELTIKYGCGGCSNDTVTELKLVYRGGRVLVSGYTLDWDTQSGIGRCDINLLAGKGFVGHGLKDRGKSFKVHAGAIALSAWSDEMIAKIGR